MPNTKIQRQLTSSAVFHTPGVFRALCNDYQLDGKTRRGAVTILSSGYGMSEHEATGLLSGTISTEIDEAAGTVAYVLEA